MAWPPAGTGSGGVLLYYFAMWLLLVVGPVFLWVAAYYLWFKKRWEPHFQRAREIMEGKGTS